MSARRVFVVVLLASFAALCRVVPVRGQVIGPLLSRGTVAMGLQEQWTHRTLEDSYRTTDWEEHDLSVVVRWGATEFATLSLQGMTGSGPWQSDHEDIQASYQVGVGLQATVWRADDIVITFGGQLDYKMRRYDADTGNPPVLAWTASVELLGQLDTMWLGAPVALWGGPVLSWIVADYERLPGFQNPQRYTEQSASGGVVGITVVAWRHVDVSGHLLWVENPQPRVSILYRF
ncbi:MAG TPA: hypothetical protein VFX92_02055 [Candidatus Krumholzibacteria bacterium]|nr:hypothetical protein [Candidatus Krumholzibacteria bacterium]